MAEIRATYPNELKTVGQALAWARERLTAVSESAGLEAQLLLAEVLGRDRAYVLAHPEAPLAAEQAARYTEWITRAAAGEPLAYLLGRRAFYDRDFIVTPDVLIPRPETERLLERALACTAGRDRLTAADIGTGSGALAVTFAALRPQAVVYAVDASPAALAVARQNAAQYGAGVQFLEGDLAGPLLAKGVQADLVMANLPYIATGELPGLAVTRWEPRAALDGGPDGLVLVRRLLNQLPALVRAPGLALFEIGYEQGAAARAAALAACPAAAVTIVPDDAGLDRILAVEWA